MKLLHKITQTLLLLQNITNGNNNIVQDIIQYDCKGWDDQWKLYHVLQIGIVVSDGFFSQFKNNLNALHEYIQLMFDNTNSIFSSQFNVYLEPGEILVQDNITNYENTHKLWWKDGKNLDTGCNLSQDQLANIRNWVKAKYKYEMDTCKQISGSKHPNNTFRTGKEENELCTDTYATWVYLADCFYGNGMSPVGTLCWNDSFNAAVVNYERDETWLSFIHELGHIFGEAHYFDDGNGGIMDYDEQQYNGLYQFRHGDGICNGINNVINANKNMNNNANEKGYNNANNKENNNANNNMKRNCFVSPPNLKYIWSASTKYTECYPTGTKCGNMMHKSQIINCKMYKNGEKPHIVNDKYCDANKKPLPPFSKCNNDKYCDVNRKSLPPFSKTYSTYNENNYRTYSTYNEKNSNKLTKNKQIDAAFIDTAGHEYLFYGNECIFDGKSKLITDIFLNINVSQLDYTGNFDAVFGTMNDIVYIIKKNQYVRYNLRKHQLLDTKPIKIKPRNTQCEFGYIPTEFWSCGNIDAAFRYNNEYIVLICGVISYTFNIQINGGFDNMYRPFLQDIGLNDTLYNINAATYDIHTKQLNLYVTNDKLQSYLMQMYLQNDEMNGMYSFVINHRTKLEV